MPTQAQIDAARRNGAKSHGPKTPEGKAISSANSLRHGLTAQAILLTNENPEAFHQLSEAYYEKFQPADDVAAIGPTRPPSSTSKWIVKQKRSTPNTRKSTTPAATPWPSALWPANPKPL